jgi:hypothetical protein
LARLQPLHVSSAGLPQFQQTDTWNKRAILNTHRGKLKPPGVKFVP